MNAGKSFNSIEELWSELVERDGDKMLFRVPTQTAGQVLSFRARAFLKRATKIANVFCTALKMKPASRVAVLSQVPEDFALILHGLWLARVVPVIVPAGLSDEKLVEVLQQTEASAVIFPPETSARIASLFGKVPMVEHWIASGKAGMGGSGGTHKLEELALRADLTLPEFPRNDAAIDGLIVPTGGNSGKRSYALFSQKALVAAGEAAAALHPTGAQDGALYWCGLPFETLDAILHNCLAPLFSNVVAYVSCDVDLRSFWEVAYADDLCFAVLLQEQMRAIHRRGKPRAWLKPDAFRIIAYTKEPFGMELLLGFEERFLTPVFPCYSLVEAGGVLTMMPTDSTPEFRKEWLSEFDVPSSGSPLPGVEVVVVTGAGEALGQEYMGSIRVQSPRSMTAYVGPSNGETKILPGGFIETGDEGYWVKSEQGSVHLFVHGRSSDIIHRRDERISPARANGVLAEIRGIEWARTLGFPNAAAGYEIGAYVIPKRSANITEASIMGMLRVKLDREERPKVVVFGELDAEGNYPGQNEIQAAFEEFYDIDYDFDRS